MQTLKKEIVTELQPEIAIGESTSVKEKLAWFAVIVAGLGYFVDVFDLWLFSNFRVASLTSLGLTPAEVTTIGAKLINYQQAGLILGGFVWGMLGDKRGRASVMFGSILIYSVANLLNAFVTNVEQYAVLRFVAGFGLAGEIGAGITLIAELLPRSKRGLGTALVTSLGALGAVLAALAGKYLDWRTSFILGGLMGLSLLLLRFMVHESGIYCNMKDGAEKIVSGSLKMLFSSRDRVVRFISCILVGVPLFLCFGVFATFAPEIASALGILEPLTVSDVLLYASVGITVGDVLAGLLSQRLQSRKLPMLIMLILALASSLAICAGLAKTASQYTWLLGIMGICTGYWACLITTAAENFGTNLRATITTTVPNLIRGSAIILIASFISLKGSYSISETLLIMTLCTFALAFGGLYFLRETFHRDLDFYEE